MADSVTFEIDLPDTADEAPDEPEPAEQPPEDGPGPGRRILSGIGQVLGGIWSAIKPDDRQPAESEEE